MDSLEFFVQFYVVKYYYFFFLIFQNTMFVHLSQVLYLTLNTYCMIDTNCVFFAVGNIVCVPISAKYFKHFFSKK